MKLGEIVHYKDSENQIGGKKYPTLLAAIVTAVHSEDCVNLTVFTDRSNSLLRFVTSVPRGSKPGEFQELE